MQFNLGNFKWEEVSEEDFTLSGYIQGNRLSKCRLHILTKLYEDMIWSDSDPEEDLERSVSSMSSVSNGKHLTGESSSDICSEGQPKGLDATRSSSKVIAFEDELIDVNHKESCKKTHCQKN